MDVSRPYRAVSPGLTGDVLTVLAGTTRPLTGREVAALVGHASVDGVRKALDRFVEHGLVSRQPAGRAYLHTLNRAHVAAAAVEALAAVRTSFLARLHDAVAGWETQPAHASLFGSAARLDGDTASDIDLFVIRPKGVEEEDGAWRAQVSELVDLVHDWTGNEASVVEYGERELGRLERSARGLLSDLRADRIDLAGEPLSVVLRDVS